MKNLIVIVFLTLPILSLSQELDQINDLSTLNWLVGTWEHEGTQSITIEKWENISPHTFEGMNYVRKLKDQGPNFSESLRILNMRGEVFYLAKVDHNNMPVPFKLVYASMDKFIFENLTHDFPKKITYSFNSPDSLTVNVWGERNNNVNEFSLSFKRIK